MKAGKVNKTIIVKWLSIIYLKLKYVFLSNVSGLLSKKTMGRFAHLSLLCGMYAMWVNNINSEVAFFTLAIWIKINNT